MTIDLRRLRSASLALAVAALACKPADGPDSSTVTPDDATAHSAPAVEADPVIDAPRMLADLETLSNDEHAGRFTFSDNLGQAADLLEAEYRKAGIQPVGASYRAPFMAPHGSAPGDEVTIWVEDGGDSKQVAGEVIVTLGTGGGEPAYAAGVGLRSLGAAKRDRVRGTIIVAPAPAAEGEIVGDVAALAELEPAGVVLLGTGPSPDPGAHREAFADLGFPVAWLDVAKAEQWMGITVDPRKGPSISEGTRISIAAKVEPIEEEAFNVLAYIPGTEHPEQIVMLGAHFDHIGTAKVGSMCRPEGSDQICNGADDNASGTAMVLEIARAFAEAGVRPARTVVFAHFAGEELGLLGSKALAARPPAAAPFDQGRLVAMVNLDMVGRLSDDGLAVGGVGSSDQWMPLLDELGSRGMSVVYERAINARSDHASFYRRKVPVLFFFTGLHDDYHRAGDHSAKINREGMASIGQLVADIVHELADGYEIAYAPPRSDAEGEVMRMPGSDERTVEKRTERAEPEPR